MPPHPRTPRELAACIDHTLLKPETARVDIDNLCAEAVRHGFAAVCVNPFWIPVAAGLVKGTSVRVAAAVGFPLGAARHEIKAAETEAARRDGASEFDMVMNLGALKSGDDAHVIRDIEGVVRAAGQGGLVKVILETSLLTEDEKIRACLLAKQAGARFVKTSTGFGPGGATVEDVRLMRRTVGEEMGVKASGGIRDAATALRMIEAGATRIGASASVKIVGEMRP